MKVTVAAASAAVLFAALPSGGRAADEQFIDSYVQSVNLTLADGKVTTVFQSVPVATATGTALFEGKGVDGKDAYAEIPLPDLLELAGDSSASVTVVTGAAGLPIRDLKTLFGPEGMKVFTRYANDKSCAADSLGPVIWVRDEDRRAILPRHLGQIRKIQWGRTIWGPVRIMSGVPEDLPIGKGLFRIRLGDGRTEFQSFNPAIDEKGLKAILALLPSSPEGIEENFPIVWPPGGSDFPEQDTWLRYAAMGRGMSADAEKKLRDHEVPPAFAPLKEALLDFFTRKDRLDLAVAVYAVTPDLPALKKAVTGIYPHPEVAQTMDRVIEEGSTDRVLDELDRKLYPLLLQLTLNHGPPGQLTRQLLDENRLTIVEDPRTSACPAPPEVQRASPGGAPMGLPMGH